MRTDPTDADSLEARAREECEAEVAAAKLRLQQRLDAIALLRPLMNKPAPTNGERTRAPQVTVSLPFTPSPKNANGLTSRIRAILPSLPQRFTVNEVFHAVRSQYPDLNVERVYVSSAMYKLKDQREVVRIADQPVTYARVRANAEPESD